MSRQLFEIEKGLSITGVNSATGVKVLFGSGAPGGDSGDQDSAGIGSLYMRTDGTLYQKKASANAPTDWSQIGDLAVLKWRQEKVRAATGQAAPISGSVIDLTANPFSDDESPLLTATSFAVDDFVLFGVGGTPKLMRVSVVASPNITVVDALDPLEDGDMMFIRSYLPDSAGDQEEAAIVAYAGTAITKLGDVNWSVATGINLDSTIVDRNGPVAPSESVQVAIEKLEGDAKDTATLSGVARGAVSLGSWTSPVDLIFSATSTIKALFQRIGDLLAQLRGVQATGITTQATVDSVPTANVKAVKWLVEAFEEATPANRQAMEVFGLNNGSAADDTVFAKLKVGAAFNLSITVDVNAGNMRLLAASTTAGVTVTARRLEVIKTVL